MDIQEALRSTAGICCFVGAGGKKTTIYRLATLAERAIVTATVRIPIFDEEVATMRITDDPAGAIAATDTWPLGVVPAREGPDRYLGYAPEQLDSLSLDRGAVVLCKADGARRRRLKAPNEKEPQLPNTARTVVPIASARVVGKALTEERIHRVERVQAITGLDRGDRLTATAVARVLASDRGGRKGIPPSATMIPLVNMVDSTELEAVGREIAAEIHRFADPPHVVLASMQAPDPLVAVI